MTQFRIHQKGVAADAVTGTAYQPTPATIKLGVDIHQSCLVVVAQEDHAMLKPARRFAPEAFEPWVAGLLARGHRVFAVYEACGFDAALRRHPPGWPSASLSRSARLASGCNAG